MTEIRWAYVNEALSKEKPQTKMDVALREDIYKC